MQSLQRKIDFNIYKSQLKVVISSDLIMYSPGEGGAFFYYIPSYQLVLLFELVYFLQITFLGSLLQPSLPVLVTPLPTNVPF